MHNTQALLERIQSLPPERIAEVEDFAEFITQKERRRTALDRLLALAPALEAIGAEPVSEADVFNDPSDARSASYRVGPGRK